MRCLICDADVQFRPFQPIVIYDRRGRIIICPNADNDQHKAHHFVFLTRAQYELYLRDMQQNEN